MTVRGKYLQPEDRDKMAGPGMEPAVATMWENVAKVFEKGRPELAETSA